jgi:hypothetical protein
MATGSILAADFGNVTTRVVLFDIVDGEYRLVARGESLTTLGAPFDDVSVGLRRVVRDMGIAMNRVFTDKEGRIITPEKADRSGVDVFIATASAGRPLRAVMVGLLPDASLNNAIRATRGAYIEIVGTINLFNSPTEEAQLNAVLLARPDVLVIAGGTDGGAKNSLLNLLKGVRLALQVTDPKARPLIVFAGNNALQSTVQNLFADLTQVFVADNVLPVMDEEFLEGAQLELGKAYDVYKERYGEGYEAIGAMSATGVLPTAQSYTVLAEYLASTQNSNVIALDMGSATTVLVGVIDGESHTRISPQHGLGHSLNVMLDEVGIEAVRAWIPAYIGDNEIRQYALNKSLRPSTIPMTARELLLEQAFLRAGIRHLVSNTKAIWDMESYAPLPSIQTMIVGGAGLTKSGKPLYDLLLITDTVQPSGVTDVYTDPYGMVSALGGLAQVNPEAVVQLLDADNLVYLGTIISVNGEITPEKVVAKIRITIEGERVDTDIKGGHIVSLPLPEGSTVELDIRLQGNLTIDGKSRYKGKLKGATGGILIDARGRNFEAGATVEERAQKMPMWLNEASDEPLMAIPQDWLTPFVDEMPALDELRDESATVAKPAKERRSWFGGRNKTPKAQKATNKPDADLDMMDVVTADDDDEFMRMISDDTQAKRMANKSASNAKATTPKATAEKGKATPEKGKTTFKQPMRPSDKTKEDMDDLRG